MLCFVFYYLFPNYVRSLNSAFPIHSIQLTFIGHFLLVQEPAYKTLCSQNRNIREPTKGSNGDMHKTLSSDWGTVNSLGGWGEGEEEECSPGKLQVGGNISTKS